MIPTDVLYSRSLGERARSHPKWVGIGGFLRKAAVRKTVALSRLSSVADRQASERGLYVP